LDVRAEATAFAGVPGVDRLTSISGDAPTAGSNIYDADGTRILRRDATGTTLYLLGQEVRREGTTVTGTRYYTFAGKLIASRTASGLTWTYIDHQGTQHTSVDAATQAVTVRRQTPYGVPRGSDPVWANQKGFVGGDVDPSGLTHLGAREYDPALGRFISVDPVMDLADPQQFQAYAYANNSPVSFSDPDGLRPLLTNTPQEDAKLIRESGQKVVKDRGGKWRVSSGSPPPKRPPTINGLVLPKGGRILNSPIFMIWCKSMQASTLL
jgi:RHS repeat-associated protein